MSKIPRLRHVDLAGLQLRLIDAKEQVVGRISTHIALILQGKDKPIFSPEKNLGDAVVVINGKYIEFTGKKWDQKLYRWHSGYPGGLKERQAKFQYQQEPESILWIAVNGMLPKNSLRRERMRKLLIFPDAEHPFQNDPRLVAWQMPPRRLRVKEGLFEVPEGFEPLNPSAYRRRFGHMLPEQQQAKLQLPARDSLVPSVAGNLS